MKSFGIAVVAAFLFPLTAGAVPNLMGYSGRLHNDAGTPLNGTYDFVFQVYDDASAGSLLFEETIPGVAVTDGYFYVMLGTNELAAGAPLDVIVALNDSLHLAISVDAALLAPRQQLASVPWALSSGDSGGAWGDLQGVPPLLTALGGMSCAPGDAVFFDASATGWVCGAVQAPVTGTCGANAAIDGINPDGTVSCQTLYNGLATTAFVPRWDGTDLVDGSIYDDGAGHLGIGTATPAADTTIDVVQTLPGAVGGAEKTMLRLAPSYTGGGGGSNVGPLYGIRIDEDTRAIRENGSALRASGGYVGGEHDVSYTTDIGTGNTTFNGGGMYAVSGGVTVAATSSNWDDRSIGVTGGVNTSGTQSVGSSSGTTDELYGVRAALNGDYTESDTNHRLAALYAVDNSTGPVTTYAGYFSGEVEVTGGITASSCDCLSDARLKEDVAPIDGALDKVMRLDGVTYDWRDVPGRHLPEGRQLGLIAQQVEEVVPEVVGTSGDGSKTLQYTNLVGLLVEAVKEQQQQIQSLRTEVRHLRQSSRRQTP